MYQAYVLCAKDGIVNKNDYPSFTESTFLSTHAFTKENIPIKEAKECEWQVMNLIVKSLGN